MLTVKRNHLYTLFAFAFALRIVFVFALQFYLYGEYRFTNNDTNSYTSAFFNLLHTGSYTFDPTHPDASFFRGPVYPFFWGIHYLLFGEYVFEVVAISQSLIDAGSAVLIYLIAIKLGVRPIFSLTGAIFHALNPFQIIWASITATEITATFISLLIVFLIVTNKLSVTRVFWLGMLIGFAILLRQYLGIFFVIAIFWILTSRQFKPGILIRQATFLFLGFCTALSPWVLRNWVNHGSPYVLMGETRGYHGYGPDSVAFESMFNKLDENITPYWFDTAKYGVLDLKKFNLKPDIEQSLHEAVALSHRCGPSFLAVRVDRGWPPPGGQLESFRAVTFEGRNIICEKQIVKLFEDARQKYRESVGFFRYQSTRFDALRKALFNNTISREQISDFYANLLIKITFFIRSMVIILGFLSIICISKKSFIVLTFPLFMFIYIPVVTIHMEMRYLIQADAILLVLFAFSLDRFWRRVKPHRP